MEYMKTLYKPSPSGNLSIIEHADLGIKRTYIISNVPKDGYRGRHAHRDCVQYLYALQGNCDMTIDNGHERETIRIRPERGLVKVDKMIWHSLYNFSKDCILVVLATRPYNESDYIRDYDEFKDLVENEEWMHAIK